MVLLSTLFFPSCLLTHLSSTSECLHPHLTSVSQLICPLSNSSSSFSSSSSSKVDPKSPPGQVIVHVFDLHSQHACSYPSLLSPLKLKSGP